MLAGGLTTTALLLVTRGLLANPLPPAMTSPRFVEEATAAGIQHVYQGDSNFFVGGGVAVLDCDDDGRADLYMAGGSAPAALYINRSPLGGALRFELAPDPQTDLIAVTGAYPVDVDGDGHLDLVVLRVGENILLRGLGGCRFERANEAWGFDGGGEWTAAFSAKWEGSSSLPTLAVGNYVSPTGHSCSDNQLFQPHPTADTYVPPLRLVPGWCTLSMLFTDWDGSGRRDLRVSNDRHYTIDGEEQLWRVAEGGPPRLYTRDDGWERLRIWGMGIASHDLTGDGLPEVFLTSQGDNKLQTLAAGPSRPTYEDIALSRGVTAHRPFTGDVTLPSTAWHAEFQDVNNDGWIDLFIAKGNVEAMPDYAARDPSNLLLGQADGTFVEAAEGAGILSFARARGAALADLNLDGLLDLVVVNRREPVKLWRSLGWGEEGAPVQMGNWLAVRLHQPGPNRDGVGSWIEVRAGGRTMTKELTVGGGHAGGQLGWIHFGLGDSEGAVLRVRWPDGRLGPWIELSHGGFFLVERGSEEAVRYSPAGT
jgi:hypothetical protein